MKAELLVIDDSNMLPFEIEDEKTTFVDFYFDPNAVDGFWITGSPSGELINLHLNGIQCSIKYSEEIHKEISKRLELKSSTTFI